MIYAKDAQPVESLDFDRLEIVVDSDRDDKVEIYHLDEFGNRIEGGEFDRSAFITAVLCFYNENY